MKRKDERFFAWLNSAIFWKNSQLTKTDKDHKRVVMAVKHGVKQKGLTRSVSNRRTRKMITRGAK